MMQKIIKESNWGYWDTLNGIPLKDGEKLIVQWPDKEKTEEFLFLRKGTYTYIDMGSHGTGPDNVAYVVVNVHNLNVEIPLAQDGILCERVE